MPGIRIDLGKLLPKGAADAVGRAVRLGDDVATKLESATDRVIAPHADGRARGCTIATALFAR